MPVNRIVPTLTYFVPHLSSVLCNFIVDTTTMKTNYYLRDKNAKKETAIILFATHSNGRLKYYTGDHVKPTNWDGDKQHCKKNAAINRKLRVITEAVEIAHSKLVEEGKRVTNTNLKEYLLIELKRDSNGYEPAKELDSPKTLYTLLERFIKVRQGLRAKGTMQRYTALRKHLLGFEDKNGEVSLNQLNAEFGDNFASFLYTQGHQRNTVGKLFIGLKVLLNWGIDSGYSIPTHYKKYSIPSAPSKIIALTEDELMRFETIELPKTEEVTRDLFLFSAYTGLRYSDIQRITPEMIKGNMLKITTKKTEDALEVYLLPQAISILEKYNNKLQGLRTNQGANKGVKAIAEKAKIETLVKVTEYYGNRTVDKTVKKWEVLTFHSAKKTHITLSLKNGVSHETLSRQVGNTLRTLKPYIAVTFEDKASEIQKAFKSIKKKGTKLRIA